MEKTMEKTIKLIKDFFDHDGWKYKFDEESNTFLTGVQMRGPLGSLKIVVSVKERRYNVYAILNANATIENLPAISEYLHRVNYGLIDGNFELDFNDGEIRYKNIVNLNNLRLTRKTIAYSIYVPVLMFDQYGNGLIRLMLGEGTPLQIIEEIKDDSSD